MHGDVAGELDELGFLATKSVSLLTSTRTPIFPPEWM
jgi:hypothetical protein